MVHRGRQPEGAADYARRLDQTPTRRLSHAKHCVRYVRKGTLKRMGTQGQNSVRFTGRIGRRALSPGRYRVGIAGMDSSGVKGLVRHKAFTVLPPER